VTPFLQAGARRAPALLAVVLLSLAAKDAAAQMAPGYQRYCLQPRGGHNPSPQHCLYSTLAQCEAARKSAAESCEPNPFLEAPPREPRDRLAPGRPG
jgi:hypothetical protein